MFACSFFCHRELEARSKSNKSGDYSSFCASVSLLIPSYQCFGLGIVVSLFGDTVVQFLVMMPEAIISLPNTPRTGQRIKIDLHVSLADNDALL